MKNQALFSSKVKSKKIKMSSAALRVKKKIEIMIELSSKAYLI